MQKKNENIVEMIKPMNEWIKKYEDLYLGFIKKKLLKL